jgi:hypothetical protein
MLTAGDRCDSITGMLQRHDLEEAESMPGQRVSLASKRNSVCSIRYDRGGHDRRVSDIGSMTAIDHDGSTAAIDHDGSTAAMDRS